MEQNFKDTFSELIESLKRSQRAELVDEENNSVLEELYVDPFEGNMVINNMMNDQTTLLIGRKGTGKSTIINKFQHEIRKSSNKISLYIDVRTIYSKSENSNDVPLFNVPQAMDKSTQEKLYLYSSFIKKVIEEIKIEINKNLFDLLDRDDLASAYQTLTFPIGEQKFLLQLILIKAFKNLTQPIRLFFVRN